jgi:hypothetical protein
VAVGREKFGGTVRVRPVCWVLLAESVLDAPASEEEEESVGRAPYSELMESVGAGSVEESVGSAESEDSVGAAGSDDEPVGSSVHVELSVGAGSVAESELESVAPGSGIDVGTAPSVPVTSGEEVSVGLNVTVVISPVSVGLGWMTTVMVSYSVA